MPLAGRGMTSFSGRPPLRVAVVGAGQMGSQHLRIYSALKGVELIGLVDFDDARAAAAVARFGCRRFASVAELSPEIEAASVAVPSALHAEVAGQLLDGGVHCLVEKPLATTETDCRALVDAASARDLVLMAGHVERYNPAIAQLADIVSDDVIHALDARRMSALSGRITDVDVVTDLMIHDIDVVLSLMPVPVTSIIAQGVKTMRGHGPDYVTATLGFESGSIATFTASRITNNKIRELQLTTARAFIAANYTTQELLVFRQGQAAALPTRTTEQNYILDLAIDRVLVRPEEPLVLELRDFVDAVVDGVQPRVSGADALKALRIVWGIHEQLADGAMRVRG